jgi:hypothetical protein
VRKKSSASSRSSSSVVSEQWSVVRDGHPLEPDPEIGTANY